MTSNRKKQLLFEIVRKREPALLTWAESFLSGVALNENQKQILCGLINSEFLESGLGPDSEPTSVGIELEYLLDEVNRAE